MPPRSPRPAAGPRHASEHDEQCELFRWLAANSTRHPLLALPFAIPNGGHRHPATAARLKAEGVKAGVWDVLVPVPRPYPESALSWLGAWIEMKVGDNRLTPAQVEFRKRLSVYPYQWFVCFSWREAAQAIYLYLGIDDADLWRQIQ